MVRASKSANKKKVKGEHINNLDKIETTLFIPENMHVTDEDRYIYAFHNSQSPKLDRDQISIYGMEVKKNNRGLEVSGLLRNTVSKGLVFEKATILLLNANRETLAKKEFDLSEIGTVPSESAVPWHFEFGSEDIHLDLDEDNDDWSLAFELKREHRLDLEDSWKKSLSDEQISTLEKIVEDAPSLKPGEVNFMGISAKQKENEDLVVTVLIRNGTDKNVTLEQLPLGVKDANGEEVARGTMKMKDFTVQSDTSKPWTFIFPSSFILKEQLDLSRWQVYPIQ